MDGFMTAMETNRRGRRDRYMHPDTAVPVVVDIRVFRYAGVWGEAHETAATPDHPEVGQDLSQIRELLKPRRRSHVA
jgi:hypothetical protein